MSERILQGLHALSNAAGSAAPPPAAARCYPRHHRPPPTPPPHPNLHPAYLQRLVEERFCDTPGLPCILVTGKGVPDLATR